MCTELHTPHRLFTSRLGEAAGPWGWCDHGPGEGGRSEQNRSLVTGICPVPHPVPLVPSGRHESGGDPAGTLVPGLPHYPGLSPPSSPPGEALGLTPTPPFPAALSSQGPPLPRALAPGLGPSPAQPVLTPAAPQLRAPLPQPCDSPSWPGACPGGSLPIRQTQSSPPPTTPPRSGPDCRYLCGVHVGGVNLE